MPTLRKVARRYSYVKRSMALTTLERQKLSQIERSLVNIEAGRNYLFPDVDEDLEMVHVYKVQQYFRLAYEPNWVSPTVPRFHVTIDQLSSFDCKGHYR